MDSTARTYCRVCEAACGLEADLDAAGNPVRLKPDRAHPVSRGFACAKGTRFLEVARHPERLLHPMRRQPDGSLREIPWEDALQESGERIRGIIKEHGRDAVGVYFGNPFAFNATGAVALLLFMKALGTRNVYSAGSQDCNNKFAGASIVHGSPVIHPLPDLAHADLVILFGTNPAISQSSFIHLEGGSTAFDRLHKRGIPMVWVDPRRTESATRWGEHLAIRPGTDIFLILGLMNLLRDLYREDAQVTGLDTLLGEAAQYTPDKVEGLTGISQAQIRSLADRIRASKATAFHMSVGINQSGFGTVVYVAMQALAYLSGNFDRRGGLVFHPLAKVLADVARLLHMGTDTVYSRIGNYPSTLDTLPGGILADEILTPGEGQIRALIVIAGDPLRTMPDAGRLREAFRRLEWLACIDLFETETGKEADVLLPATSWLERFDVATTTLTFQHTSLLQYGRALMKAPGEARPEARILADLAAKIGRTERWSLRPAKWLSQIESARWLDRMASLAEWMARPFTDKLAFGFPMPTPRAGTYLGRGPRTPGRKTRFWDRALSAEFQRLEAFAQSLRGDSADHSAFTLLGRRRRLGHNGWLQGGVHDGDPEAVAWLHADDAVALGLVEGAGRIRLQSATGALEIDAIVNEGTPRRTVVLPHGIPGLNFNLLVPSGAENIDRLSGQHRMTGIPVSLSAAAPATR